MMPSMQDGDERRALDITAAATADATVTRSASPSNKNLSANVSTEEEEVSALKKIVARMTGPTEVEGKNTLVEVKKGEEQDQIEEGSSDNNESTTERDNESSSAAPTLSSFVPSILGLASSSSTETNSDSTDEREMAHQFEGHSYGLPTHCDICSGLLVGLWSQGLQCKACHMDVHRGEGKGDHDDCRAEALLLACPGEVVDPSRLKKKKLYVGQAIRQLYQLAQDQPGFFEEMQQQMEKDVTTDVKTVIVKEGADGERTKNIRRLRERIILPTVAYLDSVSSKGYAYSIGKVLYYEGLLQFFVGMAGAIGFTLVLLPAHHGLSVSLVSMHVATVILSLRVKMILLAVLFRQLSLLFKRKEVIVDKFLRDMVTLDPEVDFGISVAGFSARLRYWADLTVLTTTALMFLAIVCWHWIHGATYPTVQRFPFPSPKSSFSDDIGL